MPVAKKKDIGAKNPNRPLNGKGLGKGDGGSTPSGPLEFSGTPSQLGVITITTDGTYDFGTVTNSKPQHFMSGDRFWTRAGEITLTEETGASDKGALNTSSAWNQISAVARTVSQVGRGGFAYENGAANVWALAAPQPDSDIGTNDPVTTGKFIVSETVRYLVSPFASRTVNYTNLSGTFTNADYDTFTSGEDCTVNKGGGGSFTGKIVNVDTGSGTVTFDTNHNPFSFADLSGGSLVGLSSGATLDLTETDYLNPGGNKLLRSNSNNGATPTGSNVEVGMTITSLRQSIVGSTDASTDDDDRPQLMDAQTSNVWETYQCLLDHSNDVDLVHNIYDNATKDTYTYTNPNSHDYANVESRSKAIFVGVDWPGSTNPNNHNRAWVKDTYMDDEFNRVIVGDNATFTSCTVVSLGRREAWSANSLDVRLNWGNIPPGTTGYAFIVDDTDTIVNPTAGLNLGAAPAL